MMIGFYFILGLRVVGLGFEGISDKVLFRVRFRGGVIFRELELNF